MLKTSVDVIIKAYIIFIISEVKWDNVFMSFILNYLCVYISSGRSFDEDGRVIRK